jgi:mRNA interferase MazF
MQRGDIWWADLPAPAGSAPGHRRPMLIVQSDAFNRSAISTVLCAAITSNLRLADAPGNVRIAPRESGLPKPSVVNVSQLVTLDRSSLTERVQTLGVRTMEQIGEGLRLVTGL